MREKPPLLRLPERALQGADAQMPRSGSQGIGTMAPKFCPLFMTLFVFSSRVRRRLRSVYFGTMPIYEFYSPDTNRIYSFFARSLAQGRLTPHCPDNPRARMERMISRFAVTGRAKEKIRIVR